MTAVWGVILFGLLGTIVGSLLKTLINRILGLPLFAKHPWLEVGSGLAFVLLWWRYGLAVELGIVSFFLCVFVIISVIDLKRGLIPNKIVYPAMVISLGVTCITTSRAGIMDALTGGGLLFLVMLPFALYGNMGWGDIKLAGLVGVMTGFPGALVALFVTALAGGLVAAVLLALKLRGRKDAIPFAPVLSLGGAISILWANDIMS